MKQMIPYEKLSKKQKRQIDRMGRGDWGAISPVTRTVESKKKYNRKRAQSWKRDHDSVPLLFLMG